ncbi:MAG: FtsX-like permease family protein [Bacteroidota bacterium]
MHPPDEYHEPPIWLVRLLRLFVHKDFIEEVEGDMDERFEDNLIRYGRSKAGQLYMRDVLKLLPIFLLRRSTTQNKNNYGMWKSNIKIAWRQMQKHRVFTSIKIGGFAVGIAACLLITLCTQYQLSYDQHYEDPDQIYRLINRWSDEAEIGYWSNVHGPLKELLEDNIPEMEKVARVVLWTWGDAGDNHIRRQEADFNDYDEGFIYADHELLDILDVSMIHGSRSTALAEPMTIVISETKAKQYFDNQDPIGKMLVLNDNPYTTYRVTGVMEDLPANSHLKADFIMTLEGKKGTGWCCTNYNIYVKLSPLADKQAVEEKTIAMRNSLVIDKLRELGQQGLDAQMEYQSYYLQPVTNIYIDPEEVNDDLQHGSVELTEVFSIIALVILALACINFVQLSTAGSLKRAKEVGLRKVVGSGKSQLILQYLTEACVLSLFSTLLGLILAWISLPFFNDLAGLKLTIPWSKIWFLPGMLGLAILIGVIAGMYPAYFMSRFKALDVLKSRYGEKQSTAIMRGGLVIFQFAATVILIIGALATHRQFEHFMNTSLGYNKDQVVNIVGMDSMDPSTRRSFKAELLKLSVVEEASYSRYLPVRGGAQQNRTFWPVERRQIDNGHEAARWAVDEDYITTMGMEMVEGRAFQRDFADENAIIINEETVRVFGLTDPIGKQLIDMFDEKRTIIGVVKDFQFETMLREIRPLTMVLEPTAPTLSVKVSGDDMSAAIAMISGVWDLFNDRQGIRLYFMDQRFEAMYSSFEKARTILLLFAGLSVFIACLGLFALSTFMIEQRSKEMSIRKVLGASMNGVFLLLTKEFVRLVIIAIIIAIPVAWLMMDEALAQIAYRIDLSWTLFAVGGVLAVLIALATISLESIKAATVNPAGRLRSE